MPILALTLAPLLALQAAGQAPVAVKNDAPETWTLVYPRIMQPYVADYRRCLTGQMRTVRGQADFEAQHRSDVAACTKELEEAEASANATLAGRSDYSDLTADEVRDIFEHVGRIHIAAQGARARIARCIGSESAHRRDCCRCRSRLSATRTGGR